MLEDESTRRDSRRVTSLTLRDLAAIFFRHSRPVAATFFLVAAAIMLYGIFSPRYKPASGFYCVVDVLTRQSPRSTTVPSISAAAKARQRVAGAFLWPGIARSIEALYCQVLGWPSSEKRPAASVVKVPTEEEEKVASAA
jgi:hypothetical protein